MEVPERVLRYLASVGMVREDAEDEYSATDITKTLGIPGFHAGIVHQYVKDHFFFGC